MKPFDLEAAKRGEPVVTRNGREFKFGAYNPDANKCVIGWVNQGGGDWVYSSWKSNGCHFFGDGYDLFMAPKKKTIWHRYYLVDGCTHPDLCTAPTKAGLEFEFGDTNRRSDAKWLDPEPWPHEVEL